MSAPTFETLTDLFYGDIEDAAEFTAAVTDTPGCPDPDLDVDGYYTWVCGQALTDDDLRDLLGSPATPASALEDARLTLESGDVGARARVAVFVAAHRAAGGE